MSCCLYQALFWTFLSSCREIVLPPLWRLMLEPPDYVYNQYFLIICACSTIWRQIARSNRLPSSTYIFSSGLILSIYCSGILPPRSPLLHPVHQMLNVVMWRKRYLVIYTDRHTTPKPHLGINASTQQLKCILNKTNIHICDTYTWRHGHRYVLKYKSLTSGNKREFQSKTNQKNTEKPGLQ